MCSFAQRETSLSLLSLSLSLSIYVCMACSLSGENERKETYTQYYYYGTRNGRTDGGKVFLISRAHDTLLLMSDEEKRRSHSHEECMHI